MSSVNDDPLSEVEILYSHNTFEQTSGVVDGNYDVQLYGVTSGPYTVTIDRQDRNGYYNGEDVFEGIIAAGQTIKLQFAHTEEPALPDEPSPTKVELKVNSLIYSDLNSGRAIKPMMLFSGSIELGTKDLVLTKPVEIKVGQNSPYIKVINPAQFRVRKIGKSREYYISLSKEESIVISSDGKFRIILRDPKLATLTDDQKQYVSLKIEDRVGSKKVRLKCNKMICFMK